MNFRNFNLITLLKLFVISYILKYRVLAQHDQQFLSYNRPYPFEENHYKSITSIFRPQNTLRNDIRRAFQPMRVKEDLLNHMIELMCKRIAIDPVYIFKIPLSEHNLIMHRSDFEIPMYPNLTETHMQLAKLSKRIDLNVMPSPSPDNAGGFKKYPSLLIGDSVDNDETISDNELHGDEIVKINAVTETNFINYVLKINDKGAKYLKKDKTNDLKYFYKNNDYYHPTYKSENNKNNQVLGNSFPNQYGEANIKLMKNYLHNPKIDWTEIGLNHKDFYQPEYVYSSESFPEVVNLSDKYGNKASKTDKKLYDIQMPGDYGFFDKTEKNSLWDLPGKLSSNPFSIRDKYIVNSNDILKNMTILLTRESRPHWPLTAKKDAHRDSDVYIARSNDPFGHSTKWQLRNHSNSIKNLDGRKKRGIKELYSMIKCSTGCDPLIYKGYGCFCGFMGSGIPVDGIDRCCKIHDNCYTKSNCPSYLEYFIPFLWKCYRGKPLCAYSHGEWGGPRSCASQLCQCDLELAKCLRKYHCPRKRAVCKSSYVRMIQNYLMIY